MTFELRQLRHLLALAEHGTFGRAAAALGMTQPALSRSVKALEERVGAPLFERSSAGVTPTDQGRVMIQRAHEVVHAADDLERVMAARPASAQREVVLGAGPYPAETIVPAALPTFMAAEPRTAVRVVIRNWDELLRRLRARELDFFVAEISTLAAEPDLEVEPLRRQRVHFVGRAGHPLARKASVRAVDTFDYPFVALSRYPPRALAPMMEARREAVRSAAARPLPAVEIAGLRALTRIVGRSDAIAALPLACIADDVRRGSLVALGTEPWLFLGYGIVGLRGHVPSPPAGRLQELLRDADAELARLDATLAPGGRE